MGVWGRGGGRRSGYVAQALWHTTPANGSPALSHHVVFVVSPLKHFGHVFEVVPVSGLETTGWEGHGWQERGGKDEM